MSKRAEEAALAWAVKNKLDPYSMGRAFGEGYEQAEKDLALTAMDIQVLAKIIHSMENKRWEYRRADIDIDLCEEVLSKFNETRK